MVDGGAGFWQVVGARHLPVLAVDGVGGGVCGSASDSGSGLFSGQEGAGFEDQDQQGGGQADAERDPAVGQEV